MPFNHSLDGHRVNDTSHLEAALLELHHRCVVDTSALGENEDRRILWIRHVILESLGYRMSILGLGPLEPNVG